jgi:hypothetical protein
MEAAKVRISLREDKFVLSEVESMTFDCSKSCVCVCVELRMEQTDHNSLRARCIEGG